MKPMWGTGQAARCSKSWEVEAALDGRLSGDALDSVARHVDECAECHELSAYFSGLRHALREIDEPTVDNAAVHRLRQALLGAADAEMAGRSLSPPHGGVRRTALVAALGVSLVAGVGVLGLVVRKPTAAARVATTTTVQAVDEGGARWTQSTNGGVEWINLTDGTLRLRVQRVPGSRRVLVRVPDGEIEDIGTTFHVVVRGGRTERVGVDEGRVTIRLTDMEPITISSGATWERVEKAASVPTPQPLPSAPSSLFTAPAHAKPTHAVPSTRPQPAVNDPSQNDATEDTAYLRAIQLLREGRSAEARAAARDYLRRFPDGFRREEMARIATP